MLREKFRDSAFRFRDFRSAMFRFCGNGQYVVAVEILYFIGIFGYSRESRKIGP